MSVLIRVASGPGELRVALTDGERLLDYALWRPDLPDGVGDLYRGRVSAHVAALGGTFIDLTDGQTGFLPDSEGCGAMTQGTALMVRVSRSAQGGKGVRLSLRGIAEPRTDGPPALLSRGPGPVERMAAQWPDAPIVIDDPAVGARLPQALHARIERQPMAFDADTEMMAESLSDPTVALPGGMSATITPTPALVAIDMDGGHTSMDRRPKQTAQFAANRAALPDLLHQLRLRNLSGAIVVDAAGLAVRKRRALAEPIEQALSTDPLRPRFLGISALGLAEIVRPRIHPPLHELLDSVTGRLLRSLRQQMRSCRGQQVPTPVTLHAGCDIVRLMRTFPAWAEDFTRLTGCPLRIVIAPDLPPAGWRYDHD
ncbi:ribonuclease [Komagataeibacter sp. FXV2]|nr:ribonuclease [Komagataeibacter sp. FXV2]